MEKGTPLGLVHYTRVPSSRKVSWLGEWGITSLSALPPPRPPHAGNTSVGRSPARTQRQGGAYGGWGHRRVSGASPELSSSTPVVYRHLRHHYWHCVDPETKPKAFGQRAEDYKARTWCCGAFSQSSGLFWHFLRLVHSIQSRKHASHSLLSSLCSLIPWWAQQPSWKALPLPGSHGPQLCLSLPTVLPMGDVSLLLLND